MGADLAIVQSPSPISVMAPTLTDRFFPEPRTDTNRKATPPGPSFAAGFITCIIIPTLNECENLEPLINQIDDVFAGRDYFVLIVDDGSSDGSQELLRRLQGAGRPIEIIERGSKFGIGSAIRDGLARGLSHREVGRLVTMDGDLSHDPREIPKLLSASSAADFVQGSRYAVGGRIEDWSFLRRSLSAVANALLRVFFGTNLREHTTYFRCYSRASAEAALGAASCDGYEWAVASMLAIQASGLGLTEVPITFRGRLQGSSKMDLKAIGSWVRTLLATRIRMSLEDSSAKRLYRFVAVGSSGVAANLGTMFILHDMLRIWPTVAVIGAVEVSVLWNFEWNDRWTFRDRHQESSRRRRLMKYHVVCALGISANAVVFGILSLAFGVNYLLAGLVGILAGLALNFRGSIAWAWLGRSL